jgi:6-phosphofructokinase 2
MTRENLIVVDESSNAQYRFGMPGPVIKESEWQQCLDILMKSTGVEYIVASGSLPEGVPDDIYGRLAGVAKKIKAKVIADTSGEPLRHLIKEGLFMIKPNIGELSSLHGVEELNEEDACEAAREIINKGGCEVMAISMGPRGAILVTKDEIFSSPSPNVRKKSTVGAGDTMVAGMVLSLVKGRPWQEVLQYGIAAGTATTMNPGTELCKKEDVERLYAKLKGKKVVSYS